MSQTDAIYQDLKAGKRVTSLDAFKRQQCLRLAARVHDIRRSGIDVKADPITLPNGKRVVEYRL